MIVNEAVFSLKEYIKRIEHLKDLEKISINQLRLLKLRFFGYKIG